MHKEVFKEIGNKIKFLNMCIYALSTYPIILCQVILIEFKYQKAKLSKNE